MNLSSTIMLVAASLATATLSTGAAFAQSAPTPDGAYKGTMVCPLPGERVLRVPLDIVIAETVKLRDALTRRALESVDVPIVGRTHGMHAEPTTYGAKFALFALQVDRDLQRARDARSAIAVQRLRTSSIGSRSKSSCREKATPQTVAVTSYR